MAIAVMTDCIILQYRRMHFNEALSQTRYRYLREYIIQYICKLVEHHTIFLIQCV